MGDLIHIDLFGDSLFWERMWQEARAKSLYGRRRPGRDREEYWNRRAASFASHSQSREAQQRVANVLHFLGHHDGLDREAEVLDIGCGPGAYALVLARRVKRVVALDPSPEMLSILKSRMQAEGLSNIEPVQLTWEEVDLDRLGWRRRFQVVLALMSPGVHDPATLRKMIEACHGVCLLGGHVRQEEEARRVLWHKLIGGEMPPVPPEVFYIFHLLYSWGYLPSLQLERRPILREIEVEEAIQELENFFYPYIELNHTSRKVIVDYVLSHAVEGRYIQKREFIAAYLCWNVNEVRE
ncbi:methyltransferase, FkbM family [Thermanaeromonas toyohensis ToBE]|uniref:Methyltransferase, FkbM family n=1 Tax=Thermanaeromonas toyohensis ToBE TaxID=698762 RepID=A0A1W1VAG7_9FIRM|nr:class I SAM-dependent methyltransferase [Thermanaeromonas toyohensis]SMB90200.1 methyltransferase, FkbM family [Thermanaeromonas toyohensis ToBE]